jgi:RNA polymerase sigma-70 factor (ECF subfamily)
MIENKFLAGRFEEERTRLRAIAYRMLGSLSEAEDAVQEAWIRLDRSGDTELRNMSSWLTTVVSRVCLDMLRSRTSRREDPLDDHVPAVERTAAADPEQEALLADSVGLAMLVVLERLAPAERIAFVLHDMFEVPFDEIALIVDRSSEATRQLASRGRRRVHGAPPADRVDRTLQRQVVEAFLSASRAGDLNALIAILDPEVVSRVAASGRELRGAEAVAANALATGKGAKLARMALVNGRVGIVVAPRGRLLLVLSFEYANGRIGAIDVIAGPQRLEALEIAVLAD